MNTFKKIFIVFFVIFIVFGLIIWSAPLLFLRPATFQGSTNNSLKKNLNNDQNKIMANSSKKILMVIAFSNFRDEEYFEPKRILENDGYYIETISNRTGEAVSVNGETVTIFKTPVDISVDDYIGVIFVGGPGMAKELDNPLFQNLAKEFYKKNKLVSAICIAPALLAKAGILKDKKATVWASSTDQSAIQILKENGAIYEEKSVVKDRNIITANGPQSAQEFGEAIVEYLNLNAN